MAVSIHRMRGRVLAGMVLVVSAVPTAGAVAQVTTNQSTISGTVTVTYAPPGVASVRVSVRCKGLLNAASAPNNTAETSAVFPITGGKADYSFPLAALGTSYVPAGSACNAKVELLGPTGAVATTYRTRVSVSFGTSVQSTNVAVTTGVYSPPSTPAVPAATTGVLVAGGNAPGTGLDTFNLNVGVAVDTNGNLYIADPNNNRVVKWAPGATTGVLVAGDPSGTSGSGLDKLDTPYGVAVDAAGNVYVADIVNSRVVKWAPGASVGVLVAGTGASGSAASQLSFPRGVTLDRAGNVFVADTQNNRVMKWAPGASSGVVVAGVGGSPGSDLSHLDYPFSVAVDATGNVYVGEINNRRVTKWAPGAVAGELVAGGNGVGGDANQVATPFGVAVDAAGNVFVADGGNSRVTKWAPGATAGVLVAGSGSTLDGVAFPFGVTFDSAGDLYIADTLNNRVVKWVQAHPGNELWVPVTSSTTLTVNVDFPPSVKITKSVIGTEATTGYGYPIAIKCADSEGALLSLNTAPAFSTADKTRIITLKAGGTYWVTGWDFDAYDFGAKCFAVEADANGATVTHSSSNTTGVPDPGVQDAVRCLDRTANVIVGIAEGSCGAAVAGTGTDAAGVFRSAWTAGGQTISITNAYTGNLTITKVVTGDPRSNIATYEINVSCNNGGPRDTFLLKDRQSKTYSGIPAGASCLVTETRTDGAVSRIVDNSGDNPTDGRVVIVRPVVGCAQLGSTGTGCDAIVTITNDYNTTPAIATGSPAGPAGTLGAAPTTAAPEVTAAPAIAVEATPDYTG